MHAEKRSGWRDERVEAYNTERILPMYNAIETDRERSRVLGALSLSYDKVEKKIGERSVAPSSRNKEKKDHQRFRWRWISMNEKAYCNMRLTHALIYYNYGSLISFQARRLTNLERR